MMDELIKVIDDDVLKLHSMYLRGEEGGKRLISAAGAIEIRADLRGADLRWADLRWADLRGADLRGADLSGADLSGAKNIPDYVNAVTSILPDGDLIGWKKLRNGRIAKLLIPAAAKRSNATGRKCRAEYAQVLGIWMSNGDETDSGASKNDSEFIYRTGETVRPTTPFDEDRWNECSTGIHFFITRYEAEDY